MNRQTFIPENGLPWNHETNQAFWHSMRAKVLTSTDVATLFNMNPYQSLSKLWNLKKALITDQRKISPQMQYGIDQEDRVATEIAKKFGFKAEKNLAFCTLPDEGLGSSYDWNTWGENGMINYEIKTLNFFAFFRAWHQENGRIKKCSPRVRIQLATQMLVAGMDESLWGVEISDKRQYLGYWAADPMLEQMILDKAGAFWKAFKKDVPLPGVRLKKMLEKVA